MTLIKTSLLTAVSTIITVIAGFIINKFIALYIGPSGLASIGNFQNFIQIIKTLGGGSISTGVVKYTAEYSSNKDKLGKLLSTALYFVLFSTVLISIIIILFASQLNNLIFAEAEYTSIFYILGLTVGLFFLNQFLLSILNGLKQIKTYVLVNIITSIVSLFLIVLLIYFYNLYGALLALSINQSVIFFITIYFIYKNKMIDFSLFTYNKDKKSLRRLSGYFFMTLASGISVPVSHMVLRNHIGETISMDAAGYWEAMWRISTVYLLLVTTTLSVYYIPKLSELKNANELRKEIFQGYIIIIPIVVVAAILIYLLREPIILILFTDAFSEMKVLFFYMLLGDIIKVAAWLLANLMLAKAMTKIFITTELLFKIPFLFFTILFSNLYGLEGVALGYFINYILYLLMMIYIFRDLIFKERFNY